MSNLLIPVFAGGLVGPIDRTAATPSISFGGDSVNNSGTGMRGDHLSISFSVLSTDVMHLDASGMHIDLGSLVLTHDVAMVTVAGIPVDGTSGTGAGVAGPGSMAVDYTNANLYINANTKASPLWKLVTRAA